MSDAGGGTAVLDVVVEPDASAVGGRRRARFDAPDRRPRRQPGRRLPALQRRTTRRSATAHPTRSSTQGNIFLTTGLGAALERGPADDDVVADTLRPPRHHRRRVQPGVEHPAVRLPHEAPARLRRELPRSRARGGAWASATCVCNINWFMNVPGRAGRHARHRRRHLRARARRRRCAPRWTCSSLVSNCPQINNPCNGFDPTPIRVVVTPLTPRGRCCETVLVANRGEIACRIIAHARGSASRSVAVYSDADRAAPHVGLATRRSGSAPRRPATATSTSRPILDAARDAPAPTRSTPATASSSENAEFAAAVEARRARLHRADPAADPRLRRQAHRPRARRGRRGAAAARAPACSTDADEAVAAAARDRVPGDAEEHRRAAAASACASAATPTTLPDASTGASARARQSFGTGGVFLERLRAPARATSRCRSFGDGAGAGRACSATATAHCNGATRRSSRRRRRRASTDARRAPGCSTRRRRLARAGRLPLGGHGRVRGTTPIATSSRSSR